MNTPTLAYGEVTLPGQLGQPFSFEGVLLGEASTNFPDHNHDGPVVQRGNRCGACRWMDMQIYVTRGEAKRYLVYTVGRTSIPGETDRVNVQWTDSPHEIIEILTVRKDGQAPRLPAPSARAIAQAAAFDEDIRDAYINRAAV